MRFLPRLEQTFGRFAVPHVTIGIIVVQVLTYLLSMAQPNPQRQWAFLEQILLIPSQVLEGEVWRLLTFIAIPPVIGKTVFGPIFAFFAWYIFYLMGTSLEYYWGTFRYNLYLLTGYIATVAVAFLSPNQPTTNFLYLESVFLAFAFLFPNFEFRVFFILPIKVKWLALITWILYAITFFAGDWMIKLVVLAAVANFFLFFWRDILDMMGTGRRRMSRQVAHIKTRSQEPDYRHRCTVCGITEKSHPDEEFRYCSQCSGQQAYCSEHLRDHEHVREENKVQ